MSDLKKCESCKIRPVFVIYREKELCKKYYAKIKGYTKYLITPYFTVKFCKNGNTHYKFTDKKILNKLNLIGSGKNILGESIKIKILDKEW